MDYGNGTRAPKVQSIRHCDCKKAYIAANKKKANWYQRGTFVPVDTTKDGLCIFCGVIAPYRNPDRPYYEPTEEHQ